MKIGEKSREGNTQSRDNPMEKVVAHKRTHYVLHEIEVNYEVWGGDLEIPIHIYISKLGLLVTDKHPVYHGHEINISWEELDEMRKELGV